MQRGVYDVLPPRQPSRGGNAERNEAVIRGDHQWQGTAIPGKKPDHTYDPGLGVAFAQTVGALLDAYHPENLEEVGSILANLDSASADLAELMAAVKEAPWKTIRKGIPGEGDEDD